MKNLDWLKKETMEALHNRKKEGINYFDYLELKKDLYKLIDQLDKPVLPKIPEDVAFSIEYYKERNESLGDFIYQSFVVVESGTASANEDDFWVVYNSEKVARAWLNGYDVKKNKEESY